MIGLSVSAGPCVKTASSIPPAAATVLLHAALVAPVLLGLRNDHVPPIPSKSLEVDLVKPEAPPQPAPTPPFRTRPEPTLQTAITPAPAKEAFAAPAHVPDVSFESLPRSSASTAAEAPAAPTALPAPSPPIKTSATDAAYASSNRKPPYPRLSRANGDEGTVVLRVMVKADGTAGEVELMRTSGYPLLDESARNTVQGWRFKPATVDGKPVAEWYRLDVPFKLNN
ncbi:energy transducer TonB [Herbaspirillum sp. HC18]|nr:energy transducer TonB [Herbaspirillum sp. HC18]